MLKIKKQSSVIISTVLAVVALVCVACVAATLPFLNWEHIIGEHIVLFPYSVVIVLLYAVLVPPVVADIALLQLLSNVGKSVVFTVSSVARIRLISWCCFVEAVLFIVLGFCFPLFYMVGFAAAFLGIVLRVVKNVIEEATDIKTENDFTV